MPETQKRLQPYLVNFCCDICIKKTNEGCIVKLIQTLNRGYNLPPEYLYECPLCGTVYQKHESYPYIRYEEIEE